MEEDKGHHENIIWTLTIISELILILSLEKMSEFWD